LSYTLTDVGEGKQESWALKIDEFSHLPLRQQGINLIFFKISNSHLMKIENYYLNFMRGYAYDKIFQFVEKFDWNLTKNLNAITLTNENLTPTIDVNNNCKKELIKIKDILNDYQLQVIKLDRDAIFAHVANNYTKISTSTENLHTQENELSAREILNKFKRGRELKADSVLCRNLDLDLIRADAKVEGATEARLIRTIELEASYCRSPVSIYTEMYADCPLPNQIPDCKFFYKVTKKLQQMAEELNNNLGEDSIPELDELIKKIVDEVNKDEKAALIDLMVALYYIHVLWPQEVAQGLDISI
jgi:hypothetical protein